MQIMNSQIRLQRNQRRRRLINDGTVTTSQVAIAVVAEGEDEDMEDLPEAEDNVVLAAAPKADSRSPMIEQRWCRCCYCTHGTVAYFSLL